MKAYVSTRPSRSLSMSPETATERDAPTQRAAKAGQRAWRSAPRHKAFAISEARRPRRIGVRRNPMACGTIWIKVMVVEAG